MGVREKVADHESVDDVVVVVAQCSYGVGPRHSGLRHDQLDVLGRQASLINLYHAQTAASSRHLVPPINYM